MKNKKRIKQDIICNEDQFGHWGDPENEKFFHPKPKVLNIFPIEGKPEKLVDEVLKRDLNNVIKFRFDPINVCNLACVFCTTDLQVKHGQISTDSLKKILEKVSNTCRRISIGCSCEPLMAKNIDEYLLVAKELISKNFKNKPIITMITNGVLLEKRKLQNLGFLDWIHISVHSHRKENFEKIERKAKFETLVAGIKDIRTRYNDLNIHIEFVANKENKNDVEGFIPWAFNELKVDSLNVRRVSTSSYAPRSYLEQSLEDNISIDISDEEWSEIRHKVSMSWPSDLSTTPSFNSEEQILKKQATTEVIEL